MSISEAIVTVGAMILTAFAAWLIAYAARDPQVKEFPKSSPRPPYTHIWTTPTTERISEMTDKITTEEGLESAPYGIVFVDNDGDECYRHPAGGWVSLNAFVNGSTWIPEERRKYDEMLLKQYLPLTPLNKEDTK